MACHNRNPKGKNQHGDIRELIFLGCSLVKTQSVLPKVKSDDDLLRTALGSYHRQKLTDNSKIAQLLKADYSITMSASTVKRRRKALGLTGGASTMKYIPSADAEQLVLKQMGKDPAKHSGVRTIWAKVAHEDGVHLTRDFVSEVMHTHDCKGFEGREPASKRIARVPKVPVGIHHRWSGDGHDKLNKIGFPIWAVVDDATGKWLGGWVVPSNRLAHIIAYLFLCLVLTFGGIPLQFTTDCGSETTWLFGLVNAIRTTCHPEYDAEELPAHIYLRSVHNISIERSWLRLRLDFGDNMVSFFRAGIDNGLYNDQDANQFELCQWLWPKLLRQELATFMDFRNGTKMRKDHSKPGPSGMSRNEAFSLPDNWGGRNCLLPVDAKMVQDIKEAMGGDALLEFTSAEFSSLAQTSYDTLNIRELTGQNIWVVFTAMLPLLFK